MNYAILPANFKAQGICGKTERLKEELSSPVTIQISDFPFTGYVSADAQLSLYALSPFKLFIYNEGGGVDSVQIEQGSTVVIAQQAKFRIQGPAQIHFTTLANELFTPTRHLPVV